MNMLVSFIIIAACIIVELVFGYRLYSMVKDYSNVSDQHFISFQETFDLTGIPIVTININNNKLNFVLDSGASFTFLDKETAESMNIIYDTLDDCKYFNDINSSNAQGRVSLIANIKGKPFKHNFYILDWSEAINNVKASYGITLHGILGADFFSMNKYIIDFNKYIAYAESKSRSNNQ